MTPSVFLRHLHRESRGSRGRLVFFVACLAAGVASVVAVAGFSEGLDRGIRSEAKTLLAADLAVRGRQPIPEVIEAEIDRIAGAERTGVREMLTLVAAEVAAEKPLSATETTSLVEGFDDETPGRSLLVELKSIDGVYPFYGDLELEPTGHLSALLDDRSVVVAPEVLTRLGLTVGDGLRVGGERFEIVGVVLREPDRITGAMSLGPRVFVSAAGLARANLEQLGSRVNYRMLVRLPAEREAEIGSLMEQLGALLETDGRHRIESFTEAQPSLRKGLQRVGSYLGLVALLSLLIGGLGVAQTVRAWLAGRMDSIAVLKCLGYRPREILWLYLGQTAVLGALGSLVGVGLGIGLQASFTRLLAGALPVEHLEMWQPWSWSRGLILGVGVALLASLPPLVAAMRVPPIRVLRRDADPLPPSRTALGGAALILLASLIGLAAWQASSIWIGLLFTLGLIVVGVVLGLAALALVRAAARPRERSRLWFRQGLAALDRPGASTVAGIVALGLGVLALLTMFLVEFGLSSELARDLPKDAPTAFLVDIQKDQWPGVEELLHDERADQIDSVPMVMARITAIDGRQAAELREEVEAEEADQRPGAGGREAWALRREQRLTYLDQLPEDNQLISGELWGQPELAEISVEEEFARELGVELGSIVTLDIQGVALDLTVTSLREVDWGSFGINFFLVAEPGVLEDAPQTRVAAARLPEGREQHIQDVLAARFPNVTMIRTREVLEKVATMLTQLALGVRLLGGLTVLAGLAILAGAVSAGSIRRGAEVALLKTLGMTRRQVMASFATEYALVGFVAGCIGTVGGTVLAYVVLTQGMEVTWELHPWWLVGAVAATVVLAVVSGLLASVNALRRRPVEVLRSVTG